MSFKWRLFLSIVLIVGLQIGLFAQMVINNNEVYGKEWIKYNQKYLKMVISQNGVYRITGAELEQAGLPLNSFTGDRLQMFAFGVEIPIFVSTNGTFSATDFVEFYGQKNTGEIDKQLYKNAPSEQMNPRYSMYSDGLPHYLTVNTTGVSTKRFARIQNDLTNLPPVEKYYTHKSENLFNGFWEKFRFNSERISSHFGVSEGWGTYPAQSSTLNIEPATFISPLSPENAKITVRVGSMKNYNVSHNHEVKIRIGTTEYLSSGVFANAKVDDYAFQLLPAKLDGLTNIIVEGNTSLQNPIRVAYIDVEYPRMFNFNNKPTFTLNLAGSTGIKYLEIDNFLDEGAIPIVYDITNKIRIEAIFEANKLKVKLPASNVDRQLVFCNGKTGLLKTDSISTKNFVDYDQIQGNYVMIYNKILTSPLDGKNYVDEYAQFRRSSVGGGYTVTPVDIEELYEQFSYGIKDHPIAIRNFVQYINKTWNKPEYLFLLGKSREMRELRFKTNVERLAANHLIPTFGFPPADNLLVTENQKEVPLMALGRYPALTNQEVKDYLVKMLEHDQTIQNPQTISDRLWMKNVIHLGGGGNSQDSATIASNLNAFKNHLTGPKFGANVRTIYKYSSDVIDFNQTDLIFRTINEGASLLTFHGHSSQSNLEFSIDDIGGYSNRRRYFHMTAMGCQTGNIHQSVKGIAERFVQAPQKAASSFYASSWYSTGGEWYVIGDEMFKMMSTTLYGEPIGKIIQMTYKNIDTKYNSSPSYKNVLSQATFTGDPAIRVFPHPGVDYLVDYNSVKINPTVVDLQKNTFQCSFDLVSIGYLANDTITLKISVKLPNGNIVDLATKRVKAPTLRDNYSFDFGLQGENSIGENILLITVDPDNLIQEAPLPAAEQNNQLANSFGEIGFKFIVISSDIEPVKPVRYSIVNKPEIELIATTSDAFISNKNYVFEIDTTEYFNSAAKVSQVVNSKGGMIKWKPSVSWIPNQVYYWKVSRDSTSPIEPFSWKYSSFIFRPDLSIGWNQSHFFQFLNTQFNNLEIEEPSRAFHFSNGTRNIRLTTGPAGYQSAGRLPFIDINAANDAYYIWGNYVTGGVYLCVFDGNTGEPILNPELKRKWKSQILEGPGWSTRPYFPYSTTNQQSRNDLMNALLDSIPNGDYILLYSISRMDAAVTDNYHPELWAADSLTLGRNLFQVLENQGAKLIRSTATSGHRPYVLLYKKNDPSFTPLERLAATPLDTIVFRYAITSPSRSTGNIVSTKIGPAKTWKTLDWKVSKYDPVTDTKNQIEVIGVKSDGTETNLSTTTQVGINDLSSIDASLYPCLKLKYLAQDAVNKTSPQLDYWRVYFDGLPDAAIHTNAYFYKSTDTVAIGNNLQFGFAVENISEYPMDSLLVKCRLVDDTNIERVYYKKFGPLAQGDSLHTDFTLSPVGNGENQNIFVEINPDNNQPELYRFNNLGQTSFKAQVDRKNPNLEVTFDGRHIMNNDIVSAKPKIVITLKDENKFLLLTDTTLISIALQPVDSTSYKIHFGDPGVQFFPAQSSNNNCARVEFSPEKFKDGEYNLVVQGKDESGNKAGRYDYRVKFQVINQSRISNILNYPNPFSDKTKFVYTLTGSEPPSQYTIQIMTPNGRVVKELTNNDLGDLQIGTRVTERSWDGTDNFGDKLANGVYFYRVRALDNTGQKIELMSNETLDAGFKNGFGKLVILR